MKLLRPVIALIIVASVAVPASAHMGAQRRRGAGFAPNPQALAALQQDLINAVESMRSALPIYDGNRVRSIHAAHKALVITDAAIAGAKAPVRQMPAVKDHIPSATAHTKYTQPQLAASQASMRRGLAALQQAAKDLQSAAGSNPNRKAINANNLIQTATSEANMAIALHAAQG